MRILVPLTIAAMALALAGCQRTASPQASSPLPPPINPAPVGGVQSNQLPPPGGADAFPAAPDSAAQNAQAGSQEFAMAAANAPDITREALLGTWQTSVDGGSCQIALSLTQWSGGYRAASLRCPGPAASIAAWDVTGNQVVLNDRDGNTVARLYKAGDQSYQGRLSAGGSIGLSR